MTVLSFFKELLQIVENAVLLTWKFGKLANSMVNNGFDRLL